MDTVSYPEKAVIEFLEKNVVPLRLKADAVPYAKDFGVNWTPTLVTLDAGGKEHHRTVGFLEPPALIASVLFGMAKTAFDAGDFAVALEKFQRLIDGYPDSDFAPEAIFLKGVSTYKSTGDPGPLKTAYEKLSQKYPDSVWTKRAYPYRLL
jgi:TolA-binding protein